MAGVDAQYGVVIAPRPGSAWVESNGQQVLARNALNVRAPPGSRVLITQDPTLQTWSIIGRDR